MFRSKGGGDDVRRGCYLAKNPSSKIVVVESDPASKLLHTSFKRSASNSAFFSLSTGAYLSFHLTIPSMKNTGTFETAMERYYTDQTKLSMLHRHHIIVEVVHDPNRSGNDKKCS